MNRRGRKRNETLGQPKQKRGKIPKDSSIQKNKGEKMIYKITFRKKGKIEEMQDFTFTRKDRCERHYWQWCQDRGYELIRVSNIRQCRRIKNETENV